MDDMNRFKVARDKGARYLLAQIHPDGSFGDIELGLNDYYKIPAALHVAGYTQAASSLLSWIYDNGILPNGDFGPRPPNQNKSWDYWYIYYNTWVVMGAHQLGRFDLSQRGMDFICEFWDKDSGGFYSHPTQRTVKTKQDLWVVAGCGIAANYTSRLKYSLGVGRWMKTLLDLQPDYPNYLYSTYSRAIGLITDHTTNPDPNDTQIRYVMNNNATQDQFFFHPGIAGGFLSQLYKITGVSEWLDLAKEYMRFAEGANDFLFTIPRSGKVGWAASELYTLTRESKYKDMAIRVGDILINLQSPEGYWGTMFEKTPSNDATAELTYWLDTIHQAVGNE